MPAVPVAVVDLLNGLLEAEQNSVFRFMGEGSPYLSRATADVRRPLAEMVETNARHVEEVGTLIQDLGGFPAARAIRADEQYLAYLSLKFLLPKLVEEKKLTIRRYENALKALGNADAGARSLLESHLAEHKSQLTVLERAATEVIARKA